MVMQYDVTKSQVRTTSRLLTSHFRSNVFCGREELSSMWILTFLITRNFTCTRIDITHVRKGKNKQKKKALSKRSPLRQKTCYSRGADTLRCLQDDTYLDVGAHHWVLASSGPFLPSSCPNMR